MAGTAKYTAVLDACVLYPVTIADILIQLAIEGLFTAKWSADIDREWTTSLKKDRPDLTDEQINYRQQNLHKAIPDWEIDQAKYQYLITNLTLPDLNDRHVLAAAIIGQADCIITSNLKDFPSDTLEIHGVEVIHPDEFIPLQLTLEPFHALTAIKHVRARFKNPPFTPEEFLRRLERASLVSTAAWLADAIELI